MGWCRRGGSSASAQSGARCAWGCTEQWQQMPWSALADKQLMHAASSCAAACMQRRLLPVDQLAHVPVGQCSPGQWRCALHCLFEAVTCVAALHPPLTLGADLPTCRPAAAAARADERVLRRSTTAIRSRAAAAAAAGSGAGRHARGAASSCSRKRRAGSSRSTFAAGQLRGCIVLLCNNGSMPPCQQAHSHVWPTSCKACCPPGLHPAPRPHC